jgi:hypothetical protein
MLILRTIKHLDITHASLGISWAISEIEQTAYINTPFLTVRITNYSGIAHKIYYQRLNIIYKIIAIMCGANIFAINEYLKFKTFEQAYFFYWLIRGDLGE